MALFCSAKGYRLIFGSGTEIGQKAYQKDVCFGIFNTSSDTAYNIYRRYAVWRQKVLFYKPAHNIGNNAALLHGI